MIRLRTAHATYELLPEHHLARVSGDSWTPYEAVHRAFDGVMIVWDTRPNGSKRTTWTGHIDSEETVD